MSDAPAHRSVLAFVPDLFFSSKIAEVARSARVPLELLDDAGIRARFAAPAPASGPARADAEAGPEPPSLVILDLGAGERALKLARALRSAAGPSLRLLGFFSHVDLATRDAALAAGVDPVLPRSAFVAKLPALLRGEGDS